MHKFHPIIFLCILTAIMYPEKLSSRETIYVPEDYETIQEGIYAADSSDVVLVSPGVYYENINIFTGAITIASLYYTTQNPLYIEETIIDGGETTHTVSFFTNGDVESVLTGFTITNGSAPRGGGIICDSSSVILSDLMITGNIAHTYCGGGIYINNDSYAQIANVVVKNNTADHEGAGIFISDFCEVHLIESIIKDNNAFWFGGGIMISNSDLFMEGVSIHDNFSPEKGGGICCYSGSTVTFNEDNLCSIYLNHSSFASDIYSDIQMEVIVDTFTLDEPATAIAAPLENFSFNILNPLHEAIMSDLYVSPEGNDLNSGTSADDPLQTISLAATIIQADSIMPHTVWIAEGTYSPSTNGDFFPIAVPPNITLSGYSMENTILDADSTAGVLSFVESNNGGANNLTITHGKATYGGGIFCSYSSPLLENLIIEENTYLETYSQGGGIACSHQSSPIISNVIIRHNNSIHGGGLFCEFSSNPQLDNVIIDNNRAICNGGGMRIYFSSAPTLSNVSITNNQAGDLGGGIATTSGLGSLENVNIRNNQSSSDGGGIYLYGGNPQFSGVNISHNRGAAGGGIYISNSTPLFDSDNRCNIYLNNSAYRDNGCDIYFHDQSVVHTVIVDTFTVMNPTDYHACPASQINFDIINAVYEQIESDLYVSTDGDNANSGTSPDHPLKTIQFAAMVIYADNANPRTIHLADGTYSPLTNEEYFPISIPSYVTLAGESLQSTILDANGYNSVIALDGADSVRISNLTITNGESAEAGGIKSYSTTLSVNDVLITANSTQGSGGGICACFGGAVSLKNVTLSYNSSSDRGGAFFSYHTGTNVFCNVTITENYCCQGGAIYCDMTDLCLVNCLIWENHINEIEFYSFAAMQTLMIAFSDIQDGQNAIIIDEDNSLLWLEGNIDEDPLFLDPAAGYELSENSPCLNAGTPYYVYAGEVLIDLDENEYIGTAPDMGAWEYNPIKANENIIVE